MTTYRFPLAERFALWWARVRGWRRRVTGFGVAVRATVFAAGAAAILLAVPDPVRFSLGAVLAVLLPLLATARPGGAWVWTVLLTALTGWILSNLTVERPSLLPAFAIGAAMYVHHAGAAIAAAWRADAAVARGVVRDWVSRLTIVLAASALAAAMIAVLAGRPLPLPPAVLVVAGVLGAVGISLGVVVSMSRR